MPAYCAHRRILRVRRSQVSFAVSAVKVRPGRQRSSRCRRRGASGTPSRAPPWRSRPCVGAPASSSTRSAARIVSSSATGRVGAPVEHDDVLAARLARHVSIAPSVPAQDLLVAAWSARGRARPADRRRSAARRSCERALRCGAAPRTARRCARSAAISASRSARSAPARGRKPSNTKRVVSKPADHQRHHQRRRSRHGRHVEPGVERGAHQPLAGVADARRAGVGHQRDRRRRPSSRAPRDAGRLGVLVGTRPCARR